MTRYQPAAAPTLYFIGVTTAGSSIMPIFPLWARELGLDDAVIAGIDFEIHADPAAYREAVTFIKADPLSRGALVTTHKLDLYKACQDLFDEVDPHASFMQETSCLSKRDGSLVCHAKDPITAGLAMDNFLPPRHFALTDGDCFVIGAGGSAIAITWHLMRSARNADRPARFVVSDRDPERLAEIRRIHAALKPDMPCDYVLAGERGDNDAVLARLAPGSLVINATGLGKDAPGSPLSDAAAFPERAIAWDLNYRGDLVFLDQARRQKAARELQVEDGWTYFIHGWTRVIAEVFHIDIPTSGPRFDTLAAIAAEAPRG
jgi:shikimate 5-dehydrogenase